MVWLLILLGSVVVFASASLLLTQRGHPRAVSVPLVATWAAMMVTVSLLGLNETRSGLSVVGEAVAQLYVSLWLGSPLFGAAFVVRDFRPGGDVLNTIFGAIVAGVAGLVVGTVVLAYVSCATGGACV